MYCEMRFIQDLLNGIVEGPAARQLCWCHCQPKTIIPCLHKQSLFSSKAAAHVPKHSAVVPPLLTCGQLYMFFALLRLAAIMQSSVLTNADI